MDVNKETIDAINTGNERFRNKKRQEKLAEVPKEYEDRFNHAMDYEDEENYFGAKTLCQEILSKDSSIEAVKIMLARVYPKLLEQDIYDNNMRYKEDVEAYYAFLDTITMNELVRDYIVETIAKMCELMGEEGYRPIYMDFVRTIEEKGYLPKEEYGETIESAYASFESGMYFSDSKVSLIMKNVLKSGYDRAYVSAGIDNEDKKRKMEIDIYTNLFYLTKYYEGHEEEIDYIRETYPHSYNNIDADIQAIKDNREVAVEGIMNELVKFLSKNMDRDGLYKAMDKAYDYMINSRPKPAVIHSGRTTYHRAGEKIGRNDLCPCGSGKKYKNCCGKNTL